MKNPDLTVKDVIDTMTEQQKKALYYFVGCAIENEQPGNWFYYSVVDTMDDNQKTVLWYLVNEAHIEYNELEIV